MADIAPNYYQYLSLLASENPYDTTAYLTNTDDPNFRYKAQTYLIFGAGVQ